MKQWPSSFPKKLINKKERKNRSEKLESKEWRSLGNSSGSVPFILLPETSGLFITVPPLFNRVHVLYFPKPIHSPTRGPEVACLELGFLAFFSTPPRPRQCSELTEAWSSQGETWQMQPPTWHAPDHGVLSGPAHASCLHVGCRHRWGSTQTQLV
jgi:hypothetical protein